MRRMCLRKIAHARSGDKGSSANIAVFALDKRHYRRLVRELTARRVQNHFAGFGVGRVERYEVPNLHALNFVLPGVLAGGGSRSLRIDPQGKALGEVLLDIEIGPGRRK